MSFGWLSPNCWIEVGNPEVWATLVTGIATALATVLAVAIAAWLTYRFGRKQGAIKHNTEVRLTQLRHRIDALEKTWELLGYMSPQISDRAIIRWTKSGTEKIYWFHYHNLEDFMMNKVGFVFYQQHAGLHLPSSIRDDLFAYVHAAAPLYFRHRNDTEKPEDGLIRIKKPEIPGNLKRIYDKLNANLKEALKTTYAELTVSESGKKGAGMISKK